MTDTQKKLMELMGAKKEDFEPKESDADARIAELEARNAMLTECLLEISEIIYA